MFSSIVDLFLCEKCLVQSFRTGKIIFSERPFLNRMFFQRQSFDRLGLLRASEILQNFIENLLFSFLYVVRKAFGFSVVQRKNTDNFEHQRGKCFRAKKMFSSMANLLFLKNVQCDAFSPEIKTSCFRSKVFQQDVFQRESLDRLGLLRASEFQQNFIDSIMFSFQMYFVRKSFVFSVVQSHTQTILTNQRRMFSSMADFSGNKMSGAKLSYQKTKMFLDRKRFNRTFFQRGSLDRLGLLRLSEFQQNFIET